MFCEVRPRQIPVLLWIIPSTEQEHVSFLLPLSHSLRKNKEISKPVLKNYNNPHGKFHPYPWKFPLPPIEISTPTHGNFHPYLWKFPPSYGNFHPPMEISTLAMEISTLAMEISTPTHGNFHPHPWKFPPPLMEITLNFWFANHVFFLCGTLGPSRALWGTLGLHGETLGTLVAAPRKRQKGKHVNAYWLRKRHLRTNRNK